VAYRANIVCVFSWLHARVVYRLGISFIEDILMETLGHFFESINQLLGVTGPGELIFHPVFIGICVVLFLYGVFAGKKVLAVGLGGLMAGALVFKYLYPEDASQLGTLIKFLAAMGGVALLVVYFGFVRE
jgi:hypothetical protein